MMDQMADILIECDELSNDATAQGPSTSSSRGAPSPGTSRHPRSLPSVHHHQGPTRQTSSDGRGVTAAIMMYSPDIPSAEGRSAYDARPKLANYYATIEREESIKCIVSTAIFLAIVVAIILVTLLENPQM